MTITILETAIQADEFIRNHPVTVIYYGSKGCGACITADKPYKEMSDRYDYDKDIGFAAVRTDEVKCENVEATPSFVIFQDNEHVETIIGAQFSTIEEIINQLR